MYHISRTGMAFASHRLNSWFHVYKEIEQYCEAERLQGSTTMIVASITRYLFVLPSSDVMGVLFFPPKILSIPANEDREPLCRMERGGRVLMGNCKHVEEIGG